MIPPRFARLFTAPLHDIKDLPLFNPSTDNTVARSSKSRPRRRSLNHIGIPSRRDTLAVHISWLRERVCFLRRAKQSRVASSACTDTDTLGNSDPLSPTLHTEPTDSVTFDNLEMELLCVGGQFD